MVELLSVALMQSDPRFASLLTDLRSGLQSLPSAFIVIASASHLQCAQAYDRRRDRSAFDRNPLKTWELKPNKGTPIH
jgi:hypothetical protein